MTEIEKLRILLPHWIEHNHSHGAEYVKWADVAAKAGNQEVAGLLRQAIDQLGEVDDLLSQALAQVGGQAAAGHALHHHNHD